MDFAAQYEMPINVITREFFFNISGSQGIWKWGIYLFFLFSIIYIIYNLINKINIWKNGKGEFNFDYPAQRIWGLIKYGFLHYRTIKELYAGIMHASIFLGFFGLFIVTLFIIVQINITELLFNVKFIEGNLYLILSLFADIFGVIILFGLLLAIYRRYVQRPGRLDTKPADTIFLILLCIIIISGYTIEALRIASLEFPSFEVWSPFGYAYAHLFKWTEQSTLLIIHEITWWFHVICSFIFISLIATDKIGHIIISSLNILFQNLDNENGESKYILNVVSPEEFKKKNKIGASKIEDFTRKQLMDCEACVRCGRCQDNCPAYLTDKPLSPKKIINDIKNNINERAPKLKTARIWHKDLSTLDTENIESTSLIGESVKLDEIWSCTNCAACSEVCPVLIDQVDKITEMRRHLIINEEKVPVDLRKTFKNIENNSNPFGINEIRGNWLLEEFDIKPLSVESEVDFLYFIGCAASFNKRNKNVAGALIKIIQKAGYKVGILGEEEVCCGDSAMRAGNEILFHELALKNLELFNLYNVKKVITTCPHGFNILKKEYPKLLRQSSNSNDKTSKINYKVYHHTEVITDIINKGKINLIKPLNKLITYHDPCFLGRYNEIYEQPRDVITAIPGTNYVEMDRNQKTGFCCGAGGSRMWFEENLGTSINQFRAKEAQATGALQIGTACPFCLNKLSDGINELEIENIETNDLAELVYESMEK